MNYQVFGIRHHGVGSARSLVQALRDYQPDCILIEGPPEGDELLALAQQSSMQPPVALLVYAPEHSQQAVFYPFALFSPEWQAIQYGLQHVVPVRFIDLPVAHRFGLELEEKNPPNLPLSGEEQETVLPISLSGEETPPNLPLSGEEQETELPLSSSPDKGRPGGVSSEEAVQQWYAMRSDPLRLLAEAAGYSDSERWWELLVEQRQHGGLAVFQGIAEAMTELRQTWHSLNTDIDPDPIYTRREALREAYMRKQIRLASKEFSRIAVVCGAWHVPALQALPPQKSDNELLKNLPKTKTVATWIPWTNGRLCQQSGYGAGIEAPGWYAHLWQQHPHSTEHWLVKVSQALREAGQDISSAHVIETVRLADTLAAMRGCSQAGLDELNEAIQTVMLFGDDALMQLVRQQCLVEERLGTVPADTPMTPLQQDLTAQQKRLRFKPLASQETLVLDLRKDNDLARSHLLRQLRVLGIEWGSGGERAAGRGTFKEQWSVQWQPELELKLIEASVWGHTLLSAAQQRVIDQAKHSDSLPALVELAQEALYANLGAAVDTLMQRVQALAAVASDVLHLMEALPGLARLLRYGDVRNTASVQVESVVQGLVTRICLGLGHVCSSLNAEAAETLYGHIQAVHESVQVLDNADWTNEWLHSLQRLSQQSALHPLLSGKCWRLLYQSQVVSEEALTQQFALALSQGMPPEDAVFWAEGFLRGNGQVLIHETLLWNLVDQWVSGLSEEHFQQVLPLLRRTFASFTTPERRQMGERVKQAQQAVSLKVEREVAFDYGRAEAVLPLLQKILALGECV